MFLATHNAMRGIVAEMLVKRYAGGAFAVFSAGLSPSEIHPLTAQVLHEIGITLTDERAHHVSEYLGYVIVAHLVTLGSDAEKAIPTTWPGATFFHHWTFEDPTLFEGSDEAKLAKFREVRDQIDAKVKAWLPSVGIAV
jgi:arsenate reductase